MASEVDCRSCGLCCVAPYDQEAFADLEADDFKRLSRSWVRRNVLFAAPFDLLVQALEGARSVQAAVKTRWKKVKAGPLQGCQVCACVSLRGSPGNQVSCAIYDRRPRTCRESVNPGDRTCLQIRSMYDELAMKAGVGSQP